MNELRSLWRFFWRMRRIVDPEINAVSSIIFVASIFVIVVWAWLMREVRESS